MEVKQMSTNYRKGEIKLKRLNSIIVIGVILFLISFGQVVAQGSDNPPQGLQNIWSTTAGHIPIMYLNAKHLVNVKVGSYYFPVVVWSEDIYWGRQSLFSYWDDDLKEWSYPDSFTSNNGIQANRPAVCSDSKGNLHFVWHQWMSDQYRVYYTNAILDTSSGNIQYIVDRNPQQISGLYPFLSDVFPSMAIFEDTLIMVVFSLYDIYNFPYYGIGCNYSTDGGDSWTGIHNAYLDTTAVDASWLLPSIAPDPNSGDMWVAIHLDATGDECMDIFALHWNSTSRTWTNEIVAVGEGIHPYACPSMIVDYNSVPQIIFQENITPDGGTGGLSGYDECGPVGTMFCTHKLGGIWSAPTRILLPRYVMCNYLSGYHSVGIDKNNTMHFATAQPESVLPDTDEVFPFNVYYGTYNIYEDTVRYGGKVSEIAANDTTHSGWCNVPYNVPIYGAYPGPGFCWVEYDSSYTYDLMYKHKAPAGVREEMEIPHNNSIHKISINPNPFSKSCKIKLINIGFQKYINMSIYDIQGRLVQKKSFKNLKTNSIVWDGKDNFGRDAKPGVYFLRINEKNTAKAIKLN
jgi:hypothetical protein